jgi:hypothetical protein
MARFSRTASLVGGLFSFVCLAAFFGLAIAPSYFRIGPILATSPAAAASTETEVAASAEAATPVSLPMGAGPGAGSAAPAEESDLAVLAFANGMRVVRDGPPLQCAIYARQRTGVDLSGAARVWWAQAEGKYQRTHQPQAGAIMAMLGTSAGHVAVVSRVISSREILIDHANWMNTGEIILGAPAVDVSPNNDWSQVRVWHPPTNTLGLRPYPVQGFIIPGAQRG